MIWRIRPSISSWKIFRLVLDALRLYGQQLSLGRAGVMDGMAKTFLIGG